jgi:hypothetical protein
MAGTHESTIDQVPSILIVDDEDASIPTGLFFGYRFLRSASSLWQACLGREAAGFELLKERTHKAERDLYVAATLEAAILRWLVLLNSLSIYLDGRSSPNPPRLFFDNSIERVVVDLRAVPELVSGNKFLSKLGSGLEEFLGPPMVVVPKGFEIAVIRADPHKGPFTTIRIHGPDGEISFSIYRLQGIRGIPSNVPQSVRVPSTESDRLWMDQLMTVIEARFPRTTRDRPQIDAYRRWAQDIVSSFRLEFDWNDYCLELPDKEIIRTQVMIEEVLGLLRTMRSQPPDGDTPPKSK